MAVTRRITFVASSIALACALAGPVAAANVTDAGTPRSLGSEGPVTVSWGDPAGFSEVRFSRNRFEAVRGDWVHDIAAHIASRAARALGPGERLDVEITDIDRAGDYEPGGGRSDHMRVVRDVYPPRIDLRYTLYGADGTVVDGGERSLTDIGFLSRPGLTLAGNDPLHHEKRLVDAWVGQDLRPATAVARGD